MTTLSTTTLNSLAREWEKLYPTAVLSGIVGDLAHKARGGYHISRQDQGSSNYSVIRADDKLGPSDRASAVDMTMSTSDMIKCHSRLRTIWLNRNNDPRMKYINAWNGWDGKGDAGRYDVIKGTVTTATADHKWHIHMEIRRRYVNDEVAMKAILSMLRGETLAEYLGKTNTSTVSKGDDDMPTANEIAKAVWDYRLVRTDDPKKTTAAGDFQRYNDSVNNSSANKVINALKPLIEADDVDEVAVAAALASNKEFATALADALSAKLPAGVKITPAELSDAVKTAFRDGVAK